MKEIGGRTDNLTEGGTEATVDFNVYLTAPKVAAGKKGVAGWPKPHVLQHLLLNKRAMALFLSARTPKI